MLSVKAPLPSSMRTRSSPGRASTAILAISLRSKLKSAEPSSSTSTWRIAGLPACRRSAISSLAGVPLTLSTPCWSFACLGPDFWSECGALVGPGAGRGTSCVGHFRRCAGAGHDQQPPANTERNALSRMCFSICARLLSSEPPRLGITRVGGDGGDGGRAFAPWRPPCLSSALAAIRRDRRAVSSR